MNDKRGVIVEAFQRLGSIAAVARELGVPKTTVNRHVHAAGLGDSLRTGRPPAGEVDMRPQATVRVEANHARYTDLPKRGRVKRYVITCAQNNTPVHADFWTNLLAYAGHMEAEVLVSQFTYDVGSYRQGAVKPGQEKQREPLAFAPEVVPYVANGRVSLAPGLVFCGELNILPTAVRPLSGLGTYTGPDSCIVPHAKIALESVASAKGTHAKMMYTTGACTLRNYIAKKEGQKAEFHHAYAALIVEVDSDGDWFVRQLNATDAGSFQDADVEVAGGEVYTGCSVDGIIFGDIHEEVLEKEIFNACWGNGGLVDALRPNYQVIHDVLDFRRRNHHDVGNPHAMFAKWVNGVESVRAEVRSCAMFLTFSGRPNTTTVVVASNHDEALLRWLRQADYKNDPVNSVFFLEAQLATYRAIEAKEQFNVTEWALRGEGCPDCVVFLKRDEEFIVSGIDVGSHGDLGPNGFRGSAESLRKAGRKRIVGHSHSAAIIDGLYVVGVTGALDQVYNRGDSSWSRTHGFIYPNGKRALVTMRGSKWRAVSAAKNTRA